MGRQEENKKGKRTVKEKTRRKEEKWERK